MTLAEDILSFWFGELGDRYDLGPNTAMWWKKDEALDAAIRERFGADLERASRGELASWRQEPRPALALVIVLDQFSRNIHRDTPEAFARDGQALEVTLEALERGHDRPLRIVERQFLTMPLMHAEDRAAHERLAAYIDETLAEVPGDRREAFASWKKFADAHARIIERFGRYPHRNAVLGRSSTEEEVAFLKEPGSSF